MYRDRLKYLRLQRQVAQDRGLDGEIPTPSDETLDKEEKRVTDMFTVTERLKREHEKVRHETARVIVEEQRLSQEVKGLEEEADSIRKRRERNSLIKDLDPFHQLYEERKEERLTGVQKPHVEVEVLPIPANLDPFNPETLNIKQMSGQDVYLEPNPDSPAGPGSPTRPQSPSTPSAWAQESTENLQKMTFGFDDNFVDMWSQAQVDTNTSARDFLFDDEDPIFRTVSVTEEEDELWSCLPEPARISMKKQIADINNEGAQLVFRDPACYTEQEEEQSWDHPVVRRRSSDANSYTFRSTDEDNRSPQRRSHGDSFNKSRASPGPLSRQSSTDAPSFTEEIDESVEDTPFTNEADFIKTGNLADLHSALFKPEPPDNTSFLFSSPEGQRKQSGTESPFNTESHKVSASIEEAPSLTEEKLEIYRALKLPNSDEESESVNTEPTVSDKAKDSVQPSQTEEYSIDVVQSFLYRDEIRDINQNTKKLIVPEVKSKEQGNISNDLVKEVVVKRQFKGNTSRSPEKTQSAFYPSADNSDILEQTVERHSRPQSATYPSEQPVAPPRKPLRKSPKKCRAPGAPADESSPPLPSSPPPTDSQPESSVSSSTTPATSPQIARSQTPTSLRARSPPPPPPVEKVASKQPDRPQSPTPLVQTKQSKVHSSPPKRSQSQSHSPPSSKHSKSQRPISPPPQPPTSPSSSKSQSPRPTSPRRQAPIPPADQAPVPPPKKKKVPTATLR